MYFQQAEQGAIRSKLEELLVPTEMIETTLDLVPRTTRALLVYGSRARGDAIEESDLDLMALVDERKRTKNQDNVSLSFYTQSQLMTGMGSLFGAHLRRDARIVFDSDGRLREIIDQLTDVDAPELLQRVQAFSIVFGSLGRDLPKYLPGLLRQAKYLLRSSLYASAIDAGAECYSVRELATRYNDPELSTLLSSRPSDEANISELYDCLGRLADLVGPFPENKHGSLEALIVNEWDPESEVVAMAMLALGGVNSELDYVEVRKVLL